MSEGGYHTGSSHSAEDTGSRAQACEGDARALYVLAVDLGDLLSSVPWFTSHQNEDDKTPLLR